MFYVLHVFMLWQPVFAPNGDEAVDSLALEKMRLYASLSMVYSSFQTDKHVFLLIRRCSAEIKLVISLH